MSEVGPPPHCCSSGMRPPSDVRVAVILGRVRAGVGESGTCSGNSAGHSQMLGEVGRTPGSLL